MVPGNHVVPYANLYRPPVDVPPQELSAACVDLARQQLKMNSTNAIAAFIIEPIQGTSGNVIPPKDFLPAVKALADEFGALLISDEMITGFGRTGKFWGYEQSGVIPDIITIGKQFGGGFPMSALMAREEIAKAKPWSVPSGSSSSYGGNPLGAAAALAALTIIEEEKLVENSRGMGEYLLGKLRPFEDRYPFIGEVRGIGLLIGIEMVKDKKTKEPMVKSATKRIFLQCMQRGLLTMAYAPSFRIQPSMIVDKNTCDTVVDILEDVYNSVEKEGYWKD